MVSKCSTLRTGVHQKHQAYFVALVDLEVTTIRVARTTGIVVNLVLSGVLRGTGNRHV